jgi:hypothetical protein
MGSGEWGVAPHPGSLTLATPLPLGVRGGV